MVNRKLEARKLKRGSSFALAMFEILISIVVFAPARADAQQPQTPDAPVFAANAKYVQGVGPGYWPTAGAGLSLNIAAGTAYCGHPATLVTYAGGSLALEASATNYVHLNPAANCAPASNTAGFEPGQIPLAKVVTGSSSITSVTEARNWFVPQPIGTDSSGRAVTRHLNSIRFADQFPGSTSAQKLDAAIADIGSGPGIVVATPAVAFGPPTAFRSDVPILDFRQTFDVIGGVDGDPDRAPQVLLDHHPGDLITKPVTGTVTLTNSSTAVTGTGTQFVAQFENRIGRSIKLDADPESAWRQVASVQSDTQMTLTSAYTGTGGTGPASYFITHLGLVVFTLQEGGNPQTGSHGESVGMTSVGWRAAGSRGLWGMNSNVGYDVHTTQAAVVAQELDISNYSTTDGVAGSHIEQALRILSAGPKKVAEGIYLGRIFSGGEFDRAITINNAYANRGIHIKGPSNHLYLIPNADNSNPMLSGRNAADSATLWAVNNNGSSQFGTLTVGPATSGFGTAAQAYLNGAENRAAVLNPSSGNIAALTGLNQSNGAVDQVGTAGTAFAEHSSGTKVYVAGVDGEAFHEAAGTVNVLTGVGAYAAMSGASGTVTKMAALYAWANDKTAGTVTNNYGLYVDPQTAGTNNYSVFTAGTAPAQFGGAVISGLNAVTFSATPTFDARLGNTQKITLTGNVTSSTLSNATAGEQIHFLICQDATGSRTFSWPSNVKGGMTIGSTASTCSAQNFLFDGTNAYALSAGVTNM